MATYTESELRAAVYDVIKRDAEFARAIDEAIKRQKRGWLGNLIVDIARKIFGTIIGEIVERVIDWFLGNR